MNKIDLLNRKIVILSASIEAKDALFSKCQSQLNTALSFPDEKLRDELIEVSEKMTKYKEFDLDYDLIITHFELVSSGFKESLFKINPTLTNKDLRLTIFIKMNLSNKEIAFLSNISHDGVKKAVQRLRKKLNLKKGESLRALIRII